jgi:hypothetical protein
MELIPYTRDWSNSVREFNARMVSAGLEPELRFQEEHDGDRRVVSEDCLRPEYFLAVEGSTVRGAYFLTHEHWIDAGGRLHRVSNFRLPLSEGFINPQYRGLGRKLVAHALERSPLLYCLGIGDRKRPLARLLAHQNWMITKTPFYFRCVHVRNVLDNLTWLRSDWRSRFALDIAAHTGIAQVSILSLQGLRTKRPPGAKRAVSIVSDFADWADDLWRRAKIEYSILAVRNSQTLRLRYPLNDYRFLRMAVSSDSEITGWALLLATSLNNHRHFGSLRLGSIVDCLALPGEEQSVIHAATHVLEDHDVDLIVSNQSHRNWCSALEQNGFLSGPTNRLFTPSPQLLRLLEPLAEKLPLTHLTRGDGAGPIHL